MRTTDRPTYLPTTQEIRDTFADEIASLGGAVPDVYEDGDRLFARAVLAQEAEVRPGDHVRAGVAVRAAGSEIHVHPYTLRQVCVNGAVATHALETRRIARLHEGDEYVPAGTVSVALMDLRLAVQACAAKEAFAAVMGEMRTATEIDADFALQVVTMLDRLPAPMAAHWGRHIFAQFLADEDRSAFGLMNAVTAVARDVRDPDTRWRLEEIGGTVPARLALRSKLSTQTTVLVGS